MIVTTLGAQVVGAGVPITDLPTFGSAVVAQGLGTNGLQGWIRDNIVPADPAGHRRHHAVDRRQAETTRASPGAAWGCWSGWSRSASPSRARARRSVSSWPS